jgi:hypothetical protein
MQLRSFWTLILIVAILAWLGAAGPAGAIDVVGTQPASLDQPRINVIFTQAGTFTPYTDDEGNYVAQAFLDTGASGLVIDVPTADLVDLPVDPGVEFFDTGVGGISSFKVSQGVDVRVANWNDPNIVNPALISSTFTQGSLSARIQLGPGPGDPFDLDPLRVIGMPVMVGNTVVLDPKPLDEGLANFDPLNIPTMDTYIYDHGTGPNPNPTPTNPGVPNTSHHVALSYANFEAFTFTEGGAPPTQVHNPFIGPNPLGAGGSGEPPPITIGHNGVSTQGSFLLDTGAAASFISEQLAATFDIRYIGGNAESGLEYFDPANPAAPGTPLSSSEQFFLPIMGIGGEVGFIPGFYMDSLVVPTIEGSADPADPNNIRYLGAPVLVHTISLPGPEGNDFILDGVFGMNFMVASLSLDIDAGAFSPFKWITYDEPTGILGLDVKDELLVPEPGSWALATVGMLVVAALGWRRRRARGRATV